MGKLASDVVWKDLPKPLNAFTVRHASMLNLNTGETIQYYSANTKIVVTQKAVTETGAFYRTSSAEHHNLNWAFEASALGLPDEKAPLEPDNSLSLGESRKPAEDKTKTAPKKSPSRAEEEAPKKGLFARFFRR